ncbi:DUF2085 domain-containing protein [Candidatus Thorarchaeota archaeon]|nr:MAG: DUF2085 domain-containing protein [Candidatus Thorarchaeota archaeon]
MSKKQDAPKTDEVVFQPNQWNRSDEIKETIHMLISHHPPSLYGHCLRLTVFGRSIYFCARCTGIYGGMGLGIVFFSVLGISMEPSWLWFLIALVLGLSTVVDWMTQRLSPRKTRNSVRFSTGVMSGLGLAIIFMLANLLYVLVALAAMMISVGVVGYFENKKKANKEDTDISND